MPLKEAGAEIWAYRQGEAYFSSGLVDERLAQRRADLFPWVDETTRVLRPDVWDGYPAARGRVLDLLEQDRLSNVAILTGDIHSSWANDVPRDQLFGYQASTGAGSLAVEFVTPAISSPPLFSISGIRERAPLLRLAAPHVKFMDGEKRGYVLLDVTPQRVIAEWYHVPSVSERSATEIGAARFVCEKGAGRLVAG